MEIPVDRQSLGLWLFLVVMGIVMMLVGWARWIVA